MDRPGVSGRLCPIQRRNHIPRSNDVRLAGTNALDQAIVHVWLLAGAGIWGSYSTTYYNNNFYPNVIDKA